MFGDPIKNEKRWAQLTLNSVCDGIGDGLHGTPEYDDSGDFYFINGNNLINGEIVITPSTKKVNEEVFKKYYRNISSNALLLSINGTLGKIAFYNNEAITLGKSACYINLKTFVNKYFVFELMKTDHFLKYLEENSTKSTIKNVSLKTIRNFQLISPPENLQNDFISFSKKIDKSKFLLQQILKKLELLKKSRFIEMFKNFETLRLDQIAEVTMGQSPDSSSYNSVGKGIPFYQGKTEFTDKYIGQPSTWCTSPTRIAKENDILMSVRAPVGNVNIATEECCIGRGLSSIRPQNGFNSEFIFEALEQKKEELENKATGSTFKAINKDIVLSIQIPNTSISIQKEYSNFVKQIDKSKFNVFQDQTASQVKVIVVLHHIC